MCARRCCRRKLLLYVSQVQSTTVKSINFPNAWNDVPGLCTLFAIMHVTWRCVKSVRQHATYHSLPASSLCSSFNSGFRGFLFCDFLLCISRSTRILFECLCSAHTLLFRHSISSITSHSSRAHLHFHLVQHSLTPVKLSAVINDNNKHQRLSG